MHPPALDGRGKSQKNRARTPDEIEAPVGPFGTDVLVQTNDPTLPVKKEPTSTRQRKLQTQEALSLYAEGWSIPDIAVKLNVQPTTVTGWFMRHRRAVKVASIDQMLDNIAAPIAAQNLIHGLLAGDKDYTLKTLDGRGHFRRHTAEESVVKHEMPPLVIQFVTPINVPLDADGAAGRVLGVPQRPKQIEGHVVSSEPLGVPARPTSTE